MARGRGVVLSSINGIAGVDFSNSPYRFGRMSSLGVITPWVTKAASLNAAIFGITESQVASGEALGIALVGQTLVYCASPVSVADMLTCTASAGAIKASSGDLVLARSVEDAVTGQYVLCQLCDPFRLAE